MFSQIKLFKYLVHVQLGLGWDFFINFLSDNFCRMTWTIKNLVWPYLRSAVQYFMLDNEGEEFL